MNDTRLVPMTKEQRDDLRKAALLTADSELLRQIANFAIAYDAAPADPGQAIFEATAPLDSQRGANVTKRVLRVLGYPDPDASEPRA